MCGCVHSTFEPVSKTTPGSFLIYTKLLPTQLSPAPTALTDSGAKLDQGLHVTEPQIYLPHPKQTEA